MAKTIKEIADELGVDKQKVYRFIKQNHINEALCEAHQRSGVKYYDEVAETIIKQGFSAETTSSEAHHEVLQNHINEAACDTVIDMLRKELEIKNEQIRELNTRLGEVTSALVAAQQTAQAAQALHAGTIHQQIANGEAEPEIHQQKNEKKKGWLSNLFKK